MQLTHTLYVDTTISLSSPLPWATTTARLKCSSGYEDPEFESLPEIKTSQIFHLSWLGLEWSKIEDPSKSLDFLFSPTISYFVAAEVLNFPRWYLL